MRAQWMMAVVSGILLATTGPAGAEYTFTMIDVPFQGLHVSLQAADEGAKGGVERVRDVN